MKIALIAALVVIVPVALYYVFTWGTSAQKKFNEARAKDNSDFGGGEVGHVAELYQVLDMTERMSVRGTDEERERARNRGRANASAAVAAAAAPALPAKWTMDMASIEIPNGPVAGNVSGSNFVAGEVVLYTGTATPILALRNGSGRTADTELLIYLRLKPGEQMEGRTWTVTPDQSAGAPQIVKRRTGGANRPPQPQTTTSGYTMKLEFGRANAVGFGGKIYLALPDAEHSAVGGIFTADVRVLNTAQNQRQMRNQSGFSFEE